MKQLRSALILFIACGANDSLAVTLSEAVRAAVSIQNPTIAQQKDAIAIAEANRGALWQRFVPQMSVTGSDSFATSNVGGNVISNHSMSAAGSSNVALSPVGLFAWRIADTAYQSAVIQAALVANQLALQTVSTYVNIVLARDQMVIQREVFIKTLETAAKDPKVVSNPQLLGAITNLLFSAKVQLIALQTSASIAEATFTALTGLSPEKLSDTRELSASIPFFVSNEEMVQTAKKTSPSILLSEQNIELKRRLMRAILPGYFQSSLGYSPAYSQASIANLGTSNTKSSNLGLSISINLDVFGYRRARRSAAIGIDQAQHGLEAAERALLLQLTTDFIRYNQQIETACTLKPQSTRTLEGLQRLVVDIRAGRTYDPAILLTAVPQAMTLISQLYGASAAIMSAVADMHAQLGDLNQPDAWDMTHNPTNDQLCESFKEQ